MSTKLLARTAIEGGRHRYNQFERRHSHRVARARERAQFGKLALDEDALEDVVFEPRPKVRRSFHDKLGPVERWLAAQANRPFRKVHEAMFALFGVRTLAERHVVFDHLLPGRFLREDGQWTVHRRMSFWIDCHGILRARRRNLRAERKPWTDARAFAEGRKVRWAGLTYVWIEYRWRLPDGVRVMLPPIPLLPEEVRALLALSPEAQRIVMIQ
jgi:hypothetical protein